MISKHLKLNINKNDLHTKTFPKLLCAIIWEDQPVLAKRTTKTYPKRRNNQKINYTERHLYFHAIFIEPESELRPKVALHLSEERKSTRNPEARGPRGNKSPSIYPIWTGKKTRNKIKWKIKFMWQMRVGVFHTFSRPRENSRDVNARRTNNARGLVSSRLKPFRRSAFILKSTNFLWYVWKDMKKYRFSLKKHFALVWSLFFLQKLFVWFEKSAF